MEPEEGGRRSPIRWWREVAWAHHRPLILTISGLVVVAVALGSYVGLLWSRVGYVDVDLPGSRSGGTTYLIVGTDSRAGLQTADERRQFGSVKGERADILLLVRVPDDGGTPVVSSIPRDLLVLEPGQRTGLRRLTLTWLDGPQATVDALCSSLGLGVDHLVLVDLEGFTEVIDAIGGVRLTFPDFMRDRVTGLEILYPGSYTFDGATALQYVRSRHLERLATGSIDTWIRLPNQRGEQAREVLAAVARSTDLSIFDPVGFHNLAWAATDVVRVEDGAGLFDLRNAAGALTSIDVATDVAFPAVTTDAPIPFAELIPGASLPLHRLGSGGPCEASLPQARPG